MAPGRAAWVPRGLPSGPAAAAWCLGAQYQSTCESCKGWWRTKRAFIRLLNVLP